MSFFPLSSKPSNNPSHLNTVPHVSGQADATTVSGLVVNNVYFIPQDMVQKICVDLGTTKNVVHLAMTCRSNLCAILQDCFMWAQFTSWDFPWRYKDLKSIQDSPSFYGRLITLDHHLNSQLGTYRRRILDGNDQDRFRCLVACGNKIISGSDDKTIKIRDSETGKILMTLNGHSDAITGVTVVDNKIISKSSDGMIKIWDLKTGEALQTLNEGGWEIDNLIVHGDKLIACSWDGTLEIWDLKTEKHLRISHVMGSIGLIVHEGKVISGSRTDIGKIKAWDLETGQELQTISAHGDAVTDILLCKGHLISCSRDTRITIWNLQTGECVRTIRNGTYTQTRPLFKLAIYEDQLISVSDNSKNNRRRYTIKFWDLKTGDELEKKRKNLDGKIKSLKVSDGMLFSHSDESLIIWDAKSMKKLQTIDRKGKADQIVYDYEAGKLILGNCHRTIMTNPIEIRDFSKDMLNNRWVEEIKIRRVNMQRDREEDLGRLERSIFEDYPSKNLQGSPSYPKDREEDLG